MELNHLSKKFEKAIQTKPNSIPLAISSFYIILGGIWIVISDFIVMEGSEDNVYLFQTVKGLIYVFITGTLLYFLILKGVNYLTKIQEDVMELQKKMMDFKQLESLSHQKRIIAHDINNYLAIIGNSAELSLLEGKNLNDNLRGNMIEIIKANKEIVKMTRSFLDTRSDKKKDVENVHIHKFLQDKHIVFQKLAGPHIKVELQSEFNEYIAKVDPEDLLQLILNLVSNARDAIEEKKNNDQSLITISTELIPIDAIVLSKLHYNPFESANSFESTNSDNSNGICIKIVVKDTGIGISSEVMKNIFEPFYTTKSVENGSGFGIMIILNFCRKYGAGLEVNSEVDVGTSFIVYLPIVSSD